MPTTRTIFGGVATTGTPVVTYTLIGICVVMFGLQLVRPSITDDLAFAPIVGWVEPWRFVTAAFLHSPNMYFHILFNMYALWVLGTYLEPMLGRARFAAMYLISAIGGQVAVVLLAGSPTVEGLASGQDLAWQTAVVGASGAIFGLFGALLVLNRHLGRSSAQMYVVLLINAVFGFMYPGISWQAHLGGFLTGVAVAGVIVAMRGKDVRRYVWPALGAVLAILVLIVVVKYLSVPELIRTAGRSG